MGTDLNLKNVFNVDPKSVSILNIYIYILTTPQTESNSFSLIWHLDKMPDSYTFLWFSIGSSIFHAESLSVYKLYFSLSFHGIPVGQNVIFPIRDKHFVILCNSSL